jgi:hypothetical protein
VGYHPDPHDFSDLPAKSRSELREDLARTVAELCDCTATLAFVKNTGDVSEKVEYTALKEILTERKWLIYNLMVTADGN